MRLKQAIRGFLAKEYKIFSRVTKAGAVMSGLLAKLNVPIAAIAWKFHCGHSKAAELIKEMAGNMKNSSRLHAGKTVQSVIQPSHGTEQVMRISFSDAAEQVT